MDIETAQRAFRAGFGEDFFGDKESQHKCLPSGEVEGWLFGVYRLNGHGWAFKSSIPLTSRGAAAVSVYLAALDHLAPNHITDLRGEVAERGASA